MTTTFTVIIALIVLGLLGGPAQPAGAEPAAPTDGASLIFHITDTHVGASSIYDTQKGNLRAWVDFANGVPELAGSVSSGDLVEWSDSQADFDAYFTQVSRLTRPHITAPGNHDYQSSTGHSYAGYGYPRYSSQVIGDFMFVSTDSETVGLNFTSIEDLLKLNRGRYRLGIIQHYPLYVPPGTTCGGSDCALSVADADKFKDLAARYDVELFLVGHDHAFFYTRDKDVFFEQFASADLGLSNQYAMIYEDGERLAYGNNKDNGSPPFAPLTPQRWDALNLVGKILTADPIKVRALGTVASAQYQINGSAWASLADQGNGVWSANYNWTQLTRDANALLSIKLVSATNVERIQSYVIRVAPEYPNQPAAVSDQTNLPASGWNLGTVPLVCGATDDGTDITRGEWFVDGVRAKLQSVGWTSAVTFRYDWNTAAAGYGEHILRCKVSDRFGRVARTARRYVTITPPPPAITVAYAPPAMTLTWTTGATGLQSEVWASATPQWTSPDTTGSELVQETAGTTFTDGTAGSAAGLRCYRVRTRSANGVTSPWSGEVGKFSYEVKSN